jgi:hypothetical protein
MTTDNDLKAYIAMSVKNIILLIVTCLMVYFYSGWCFLLLCFWTFWVDDSKKKNITENERKIYVQE